MRRRKAGIFHFNSNAKGKISNFLCTPSTLNAMMICKTSYFCIYHGLVAQLGEHHLDKVGVAGSRPVGTIFNRKLETLIYQGFQAFFLL